MRRIGIEDHQIKRDQKQAYQRKDVRYTFHKFGLPATIGVLLTYILIYSAFFSYFKRSLKHKKSPETQQPDGSITLDILGGVKAVFRPREGLDLAAWFAERDRKAAAHAAERLAKSQEKGYVEKGNKDEPFRYHIAKVEEEDDSLQEEPILTNEDLVLGIRPEFLNITSEAPLKGEIYGAMPTGMESTIKVYVNGFLLTGVVFGSSLFTIGEQHSISFTGHHIMLFDRQSGDCIALGSLETL